MVQINPREIAAEAIMEILVEEGYNNTVLRRILRQNGAMPVKDRSLVTQMVNGTLRNLYYIDYVINQFSKTKTQKMKPWILAVMRTAVYQMVFMNIPDSAACNEAVKLVESRGLAPLKGFVNGVLRSIGRGKDDIILPEEKTAEFLSIRYSHPLWLVRMWIAYFGYAETQLLCAHNNVAPDVSIRVNTLRTTTEELKQSLEKKGVTVKRGTIVADSLHLKGSADLGKLTEFKDGLFHVQDESSQLAVAIMAPKKGDKVLDLCSAPGGKSFTIAQMMEDSGELVAGDIFPHKIELVAEGANRLGIRSLQAVLQDATEPRADYVEQFDAVLVDAPCSGLGLIGKKPDIRLKKSGEEIDALVPIQRAILENASKYVKPNGTLIYSTCTLCKKENEKNIEWFLQNNENFVCVDISDNIPEFLDRETAKKGYITLLPHVSHTDGFFIAKLIRRG